jgi:hypothetical protein
MFFVGSNFLEESVLKICSFLKVSKSWKSAACWLEVFQEVIICEIQSRGCGERGNR